MIHCPACDIDFSPSYAHCPRCKVFVAPLDKRMEFFRREAAESVLAGANPERVRERLVAKGLSEFEAKEIVGVAASSLRTEKRGYGFFRIVVGIPVALFGLVPTFVGVAPTFHGRGPNLILLLGGGAILIVGVWAVLSGIYALILGKEVDD
jgi:hypothetical protein